MNTSVVPIKPPIVKFYKPFEQWSDMAQVKFIETLITSLNPVQQGQLNTALGILIQRDFITLLTTAGLPHIVENILKYLDAESLLAAELVSKQWVEMISEGNIWKKLLEQNVNTAPVWNELAERRGWIDFLFIPSIESPTFYRQLYANMQQDLNVLDHNWRLGSFTKRRFSCLSFINKGIYCMQCDTDRIVTGSRDRKIKVWSRADFQCIRTIEGHIGSVLCLQHDGKIIISGSSDSTARVWDMKTTRQINILTVHTEAVQSLKFSKNILITASKDHTFAVWLMNSPTDIKMLKSVRGHIAAVSAVDFDEKYIVTASGDRTICVWCLENYDLLHRLKGHQRGIACMQYANGLIVSGGPDCSVRLWDAEKGVCLRVLDSHEVVRSVRFNSKYIVSGYYDGEIKVWDLKAALDEDSLTRNLCLYSLIEHASRIYRLHIDDFYVISSSLDDTICIWNFLNDSPPESDLKCIEYKNI